MSLRMCEETPNRASPSRPLAVINVTYRIVDLGPTKLRVSISASMTKLWPGATVEELARPLVQPHEGRRPRIVIGSASRLTIRKSCLTFTPRGTIPKSYRLSGKSASVHAASAPATPTPISSQLPRTDQHHGRAIVASCVTPLPHRTASPPAWPRSLHYRHDEHARLVLRGDAAIPFS